MIEQNENLRKAAILVDSLDSAAADVMLDQMPPLAAAAVRNMVIQLGDVADNERERVLEDFLSGGHPSQLVTDGGIELDASLAEKLSDSRETHVRLLKDHGHGDVASPFRFLHEASAETLVEFLRHERPQTIAIVAGHLQPQRAAGMIARLAPSMQAEVLRRIARIDQTDPEIIRDVEDELQTLLIDQSRTAQQRDDGLATVRAILDVSEYEDRKKILDSITEHDRDLASQLGRPLVVMNPSPAASTETSTVLATDDRRVPVPSYQVVDFAELSEFDDRSLSRVFRAADPRLSLLALTGASSVFVNRILSGLPARDAELLTRQIEHSGPLRLRDVEIAQQQLARIATQLVGQGDIALPASRRFATAA